MGVAAPPLPRRQPAGRPGITVGTLPLALGALLLLAVMALVGGTVVDQGGCRPGAVAGSAALPGDSSAPGSLGGVAGTGLSRAQILAVRSHGGTRVTLGTYSSTSYGPPWGGIQGAGQGTAGGVVLNGGSPRYYMVAVDPAVVQLGALLYAWPNPFKWKGPFLAADTGGAIDGQDLDFYDWRGRSTQYAWGRHDVKVSADPIKGGGSAGAGPELVDVDRDPDAEASTGAAADFSAAERTARAVAGRPVGFSVSDAQGNLIADVGANRSNLGRSASKALVLVALARTAPKRDLTAAERGLAAAMIRRSDNAAASRLYARVGGEAVDRTARLAGMTGWRRDTSDPVYTLGESWLTAGDLARLFAQLDQLVPKRHRSFARELLGSVEGAGRFGFVDAGLGGDVLTKGGWSPEARGWTVNQGAQFKLDGQTYGAAVVLGGQTTFASGAAAIKKIAGQVAAAQTSTAATAGCGGAGSAELAASGPLGQRIGKIARSHLGATGAIYGFSPSTILPLPWCAWFTTNVWAKAGVPIQVNYLSNAPYLWALPRGQLFKKDGSPPKGKTPPQGSALMYGSGPQDANTSEHVNMVDQVNPDGSFMVSGGNQGGGRVTRFGPCRLSVTEPAYLSGPGCDPRPVYGIAVPSTDRKAA